MTGAITASHTELNSVTNRVSKSGDTYTGTHNNMTGATVTAATQTTGDNSTKISHDRVCRCHGPFCHLAGSVWQCWQVPDNQRSTASWATVSVGGISLAIPT